MALELEIQSKIGDLVHIVRYSWLEVLVYSTKYNHIDTIINQGSLWCQGNLKIDPSKAIVPCIARQIQQLY
jgi:hypothetical protein